MHYSIQIAQSEPEKRAIFRLRYDIYINEQRKDHFQPDHHRQLLVDAADAEATQLYATGDNSVLGAIRLHLGPTVRNYEQNQEVLLVDKLTKIVPVEELAVVDRLMVRPENRHSRLVAELMIAAYQQALATGKKIALMVTEAKYVPLYRHLGFRLYDTPLMLPDGQLRYRMILFGCDRAELTIANSPFLPYLPDSLDDGGIYLRAFRRSFGKCFIKCPLHSLYPEAGCPFGK